MKKITLILLTLSFILSLASCGEKTESGISVESGISKDVSSAESKDVFSAESVSDESETLSKAPEENSDVSEESEEDISADVSEDKTHVIIDVNEYLKSQKQIVGRDSLYLDAYEPPEIGELYDFGLLETVKKYDDDTLFCLYVHHVIGDRDALEATFSYNGKTRKELQDKVYNYYEEDKALVLKKDASEEDIAAYYHAANIYFDAVRMSEMEYMSKKGFICVEYVGFNNSETYVENGFVAFATKETILNFQCLPDRKYSIDLTKPEYAGYKGDNVVYE